MKIGDPGWRPTEVHPLAALFPMMRDDELDDLAADIKANGLLHPVLIDDQGVLIDGRNRLDACDRAKVEPRYERTNGHDVAALIISANISRRSLSNGQRAMLRAMIHPEPEKGGRGKRSGIPEGFAEGISKGQIHNLLSGARQILKFSQSLSKDVAAGNVPFDTALKQARAGEDEGKSREARVARLRASAPDVAALVEDERLTLEAGLEELAQRERATRHVVSGAEDSVGTLMATTAHVLVVRSLAALTPADLALIKLTEDDRKAVLEKLDIDALKAAVRDLEQIKRGRL